MSRTAAMRRLRAADPVSHLPASRTIDGVIPGWPMVDRLAADHWPDALDGRHAMGRKGSSGSRVSGGLAAVFGVAVTIAVVVFALVGVHAGKRTAPSAGTVTSTGRYTSEQGWSLTYPSALRVISGTPATSLSQQMTLTSFAAPRKLAGRVPTGTRINFDEPAYTLPLDAAGRFPADGVALIVQTSSASVLGPDSAFPVALTQFGRPHSEPFFTGVDDRRAAVPLARTHTVVGYSQEMTVTALIGAKASPALRSDIASTIASLSFRRLAPGSQVGPWLIVGPASPYPVGSFTLVHAQFGGGGSEPVYLVHAPGQLGFGHQCLANGPCTPAGSFYGIGPEYNTRLDHAPVCQLRLDRPDDDFYCANMGVRWDRVGRVIARPANESYVGSIEGLYAKVTWDGQVMITRGWGPQLSRPAVHQLWPSWKQPNEPLSR